MNSFDSFKEHGVVITGFSKTGTTLLLSLLDYHPELLVYPEESKYLKRAFVQGNSSLEKGKKAALETTKQLALGQKGGAAAEAKRDYTDLDLNFFSKRVKETIEKSESHKDIFLGYLEAFYDTQMQSPRFPKEEKKAWVVKRPSDYYLFHKYKKWFPKDKLVWLHLRRNPYDNYASIHLSKSINRSGKWTARHFAPDWLLSELFAKKLKKELANFHTIAYEDLVSKPEVVMHRVADVIGISFTESLLVPTLNGHPWSGNASSGTQFKGVSKGSVGAAQSRLSEEQRSEIEYELTSLRNKLAARKRYYSMMWHRHFPGKKEKFY